MFKKEKEEASTYLIPPHIHYLVTNSLHFLFSVHQKSLAIDEITLIVLFISSNVKQPTAVGHSKCATHKHPA